MTEIGKNAYSYREDPAVPSFDDAKPLFIFDGVCVMCSTGARWLMHADRERKINLTSVQTALGQALYRHYGVDPDESYLLIFEGRAFTASRGYLELFKQMGGILHLFRLMAVIPESWRDWLYALIARNRYRLFGKSRYCEHLPLEQRKRLL